MTQNGVHNAPGISDRLQTLTHFLLWTFLLCRHWPISDDGHSYCAGIDPFLMVIFTVQTDPFLMAILTVQVLTQFWWWSFLLCRHWPSYDGGHLPGLGLLHGRSYGHCLRHQEDAQTEESRTQGVREDPRRAADLQARAGDGGAAADGVGSKWCEVWILAVVGRVERQRRKREMMMRAGWVLLWWGWCLNRECRPHT